VNPKGSITGVVGVVKSFEICPDGFSGFGCKGMNLEWEGRRHQKEKRRQEEERREIRVEDEEEKWTEKKREEESRTGEEGREKREPRRGREEKGRGERRADAALRSGLIFCRY
jgi:hypothetical protein